MVFRISGNIELGSPLSVRNPYITIAGQTAPGDGICLKYAQLSNPGSLIDFGTHDIVIRYVRLRAGFPSETEIYGGAGFARVAPDGYPVGSKDVSNVMVDHCSMSWTAGRVFFDGADLTRMDGRQLRSRRREFQIIFQDPLASIDPRMTVRRIVSASARLWAMFFVQGFSQ